jgi:hypothetical protein
MSVEMEKLDYIAEYPDAFSLPTGRRRMAFLQFMAGDIPEEQLFDLFIKHNSQK